jgi:hypothetical protein
MSDIENDAMSFWDGAIVQGFGLDDRKQCVGVSTRCGKSIKELVTKLNLSLGYRHFRKASLRAINPAERSP